MHEATGAVEEVIRLRQTWYRTSLNGQYIYRRACRNDTTKLSTSHNDGPCVSHDT
ncbi:hypothetical protein Micbo1qcDRAFT_165279, partial [Microdochium bolleyi]